MKINALKGLANPWSFVLLMVFMTSTFVGLNLLYRGIRPGTAVASLILAGIIASGFRILKPAPREVGVISVLGNRTNSVVEGITLLLEPFGIEIIGATIFIIKTFDHDFPVESVRCADGVRVKGKVSLSWAPDESSAEKLWQYYDIGMDQGFIGQADDIIVIGSQEIVAKTGRTYKWAEIYVNQIGVELRQIIEQACPRIDGNENDDMRGFGIVINKLQPKFTPINANIITADEDIAIEERQRAAELLETETINQQARARKELYTKQGLPDVSIQKCRDEIMFERLAKDEKVTITQGGRIVNLGSVGNTDKSTERT